jgi:hypothetical protein
LDSPRWQSVEKATAVGSPNSFSQDGVMYNAGWAVDTVDYGLEDDDGKIKLRVMLACRGSDSRLSRIGFQVTALGVRRQT